MSWNKVYKKWGMSTTAIDALNIITWITLAALIIIGVCLIISAGVTWFKMHHSTDGKDISGLKKERRKQFLLGVLCCLGGVLWPIILGILDAAGVGNITSGNFVPKSLVEVKTFIGV